VIGIIACVGFGDLLEITLPNISKTFEKVIIITDFDDKETYDISSNFKNIEIFKTNIFYERDASFNRGAAYEEILDKIGRTGWICFLDADILLPDNIQFGDIEIGNIYAPRRIIVKETKDLSNPSRWGWPPKDEGYEFPGYFQLFNGDDPVLTELPWYSKDYGHVGCSDTKFQARWTRDKHKRLNFNVLHLGADGENWFGRVTPRIDGKIIKNRDINKNKMQTFLSRCPDGESRFRDVLK